MTLSPPARKLALAIHLTVSVGWVGAAVAYLALAIAAARSTDPELIRSAWVGMELIGWWVLVPLAIATVLTGVVMSLGSAWGLLRHYWVVLSLTLTLAGTAVLVLHMPDVSDLQSQASRADAAGLEQQGSDVFHSATGLVLLLVILALNVYKPRGLTRYGWRRQREQSTRRVEHLA
ncbi:DUF2269 domain-containing protein [Nocardioides sp. InS609-2]|uniref:DUF2269 family protein n=1 Tax=Nocardioides sp. InS609-2 TaxID=2760705 RepID=UPI0020C17559|nr:DUF2269 domain-containing protein [Nocardioides sp. InS609-2]